MKTKLARYYNRILNWSINLILLAGGLVVLWLFVQVFVITSFRVPTDSMEPELMAGDVILVNKLAYGARIFNVKKALDGQPVEITRLPGIGAIERNDVVAFHNPCPKKWRHLEMDMMAYYVKRCVALPGDVFHIVDGVYKVSGVQGDLGNIEAQHRFFRWAERGNIPEDSVGIRAYPDSQIGWTVFRMGPFYIPKAGDTIPMNNRTLRLYRHVIEWEQQVKMSYKDGCVRLKDKVITGYRFKKSYYFMAGDKVENSRDSRYWGLLPEEYIVGKVWRIGKSVNKNTGKIRWNRVLKQVK